MSIRPTTRTLLATSALLVLGTVGTLGACSSDPLTAPSRIAPPSTSAHDGTDSSSTCISGYSIPDGRAC